jgi:hypothetical protein
MSSGVGEYENTPVERLLAEFTESLRVHGRPDFSLLELCPPDLRRELLSLMNVAALSYRALGPEREAFRARKGAVADEKRRSREGDSTPAQLIS